MLQHSEPEDFVIATGETHTIREFLDMVFGQLDLDWHDYVEVDPRYFRPAEVDLLLAMRPRQKRNLAGLQPLMFANWLASWSTHDLELAERELHAEKFKSS